MMGSVWFSELRLCISDRKVACSSPVLTEWSYVCGLLSKATVAGSSPSLLNLLSPIYSTLT